MNLFEGVEITIKGFGHIKSASIISTNEYKIEDIKKLSNELVDGFMNDVKYVDGSKIEQSIPTVT